MAITKEDILEAIGGLTVMELNDLVKEFETKFGVSAAAVAIAAGPGAALLLLKLKKSRNSWKKLAPKWKSNKYFFANRLAGFCQPYFA